MPKSRKRRRRPVRPRHRAGRPRVAGDGPAGAVGGHRPPAVVDVLEADAAEAAGDAAQALRVMARRPLMAGRSAVLATRGGSPTCSSSASSTRCRGGWCRGGSSRRPRSRCGTATSVVRSCAWSSCAVASTGCPGWTPPTPRPRWSTTTGSSASCCSSRRGRSGRSCAGRPRPPCCSARTGSRSGPARRWVPTGCGAVPRRRWCGTTSRPGPRSRCPTPAARCWSCRAST